MAAIDTLLERLKDPSPTVRIGVLRVLAMLEETLALPVLRGMVNTEQDTDVLPTLKWAGNLIWRAQQSGYTTEAGMHQFFRLDLQKTDADKKEEELLEKMQYQFDMEMLKAKQASNNRKLGQSIVMGALGAALSGTALGANILMNSASNNAKTPSASDTPRPAIGSQPITPQRPTDFDISIWIEQLKADDPTQRQKAIFELRSLNNTAALPFIAELYATDPDTTVKDEAQRCGKALYFNWVFWAPQEKKPDPALPAPQSEVAQILEKAEAARRARKK